MARRFPASGACRHSFQGGLPAVSISGGFSSFGRQTTNPQFQNPAIIDPSVGYTWIKGNQSLKFGYEFEHIWMGVFDNNPPYGSFTFGGSYSSSEQSRRCLLGGFPLRHHQRILSRTRLRGPSSPDTRQRLRAGRLEGVSQPDFEPRSTLGVRLALFGAE